MRVPHVSVCLLILTSLAASPVVGLQKSEDGRVVLNLGFLTSESGRFTSDGTFPAAQLAVECINNQTDLLRGYYLNLSTYDTKCDEATSMDVYFDHWTSAAQPGPLFFGGGCSLDTGLPADVSRTYHTVQVTSTAGSPIFSNKTRYPYLFRAIPPETEIHRGQAVLVKHFKWDQVAIVVQNEHIFSEDLTDIENFMRTMLNISYVRTHLFPTRLPLEGIEALWSNTPRVVIINAYEAYTREILCQAFQRKLYYPNYQFIVVGWYPDNFWLNHTDDTDVDFTPSCTTEEFEQYALYNLLTVNFNYSAPNLDAPTICDMSARSFLEWYEKKINELGLSESDFAGPTFDAVYATALALNDSIPILESKYNLRLEDFTFGDFNSSMKFASVVQQNLAKVNFSGVSGPFGFNEQLDRPELQIIVEQYRNVNNSWGQVMVGEVTLQNMSFQVFRRENIFPEGVPMEQPISVHVALYAVMVVLAAMGIAFALVCFIFKLAFRNTGYIKMTSPNISYFIPLGAILLYSVVIVAGVPVTGLDNMTVICNFELWLGSLGFTLIFGGILVRTWRIHFIFNRIVVSKVKAKPPKDWMLIAAIGVFLAIDMVYLVIVTAVPHTRIVGSQIEPVLSTFVVEVCTAEWYLVTVVILAVYKSVYLWVGLYLAFETRKVKLKALHDSQYIAASVYVSIMTCIACIPVAIWLREMVDVYYGVLNGILMLGLTTVLALTFLPKMVGLYRYRDADVMEFGLGSKSASASVVDATASTREVASLQEKVKELTSKLAEFDKSIVSASDTVTPSDAAAVKINSQIQLVGYSVNRSSGNGEPNNDDPRGPSV